MTFFYNSHNINAEWQHARYELREEIGRGAMGSVHRAIDRLSGDALAIKHVATAAHDLTFATRPDTDSEDSLRIALAREFQTLATLRHPYIVSVLDFGFDRRQRPFFAMEYLKSARSIIDPISRSKSMEARLNWVLQLLQALSYLHRRGILHRDLKPGNVLVANDRVRVVDFGLAVTATHASGRIGTPMYMAPEVLLAGRASVASDLYAVGILAYQLFTGVHPMDVPTQTDDVMSLVQPSTSVDMHRLPLDYQLTEVIGRLLESDPAKRFPDAETTIEAIYRATNRPMPRQSKAERDSFLQASTFVGRDAEIRQLQVAYRLAVEGKGSGFLIGGESGVGKSRLMNELRIWGLVQGATVVNGQAQETGGGIYELWREPLRQLSLHSGLTDLQAGILREIAPDLPHLIGRDLPPVAPLTGRANQRRLAVAIADVIRASKRPIILILEDLHWLEESIDLLSLLQSFIFDLPVLVVASYRNDERPEISDRLEQMTVIKLGRLNEAAISHLSRAMIGPLAATPKLIEFLQRETEGNAFFLVEVVRALARDVGRLADIGRADLPPTVIAGGIQQLMERRLNRISDEALALLEIAAVVGRQINLPLLELITSADKPKLQEWLFACNEASILEAQENNWRFSHDKLRESLMGRLSAERRRRLNADVAIAYEQVFRDGPDLEENRFTIASHWLLAEQMERLIVHAPHALQRLRNVGANQEGLRFLQESLAVIERRKVADVSIKRRLLSLLAYLYVGISEWEKAESVFEQALAIPENDDLKTSAELMRGLASINVSQANYARARDYLKESLKYYQRLNDQQGIAQINSDLGNAGYKQGLYDEAVENYNFGLSLFEKLEDRNGVATCLNGLGLLADLAGNYDEAMQYHERSIKIRREMDHLPGLASSHNNLGITAYSRGRYDEAIDHYEKSLQLRQEIGDLEGESATLNNLGVAYELSNRLEDALDYYGAALALKQKIGMRSDIAGVWLNLGDVYLTQDKLDLAEEHYLKGMEIIREIKDHGWITQGYVGLLNVYRKQGRPEDAMPLLRLALDDSEQSLITQRSFFGIIIVIAMLLSDQDYADTAAKLLGMVAVHHRTRQDARSLAEQSIQELNERFDTDLVEAAVQAGRQMTFEDGVALMYAHLDKLTSV